MYNDEKKFHPIFQILHIKSAWFLLELAMALVSTIGMRFLQVCPFVPTGLSDNAKKEGFPGCDSNLKLRLARQSDVAMWEFFADSYSMQNSGGVWRPQLTEIIYVGEFLDSKTLKKKSWISELEFAPH